MTDLGLGNGDLTVITIRQCAHVPFIDRPEELSVILSEFLDP